MINEIKNMMSRMSPEQIVMNMAGNNPVINNLIKMGKEGNTQGIENFARNMMKEQGRDFDKEFSEFKNMFK